MTETGKVFLRYLYKRFGWKVIHHRKKLFRIIHKRAFETSMKKLKFVIFTNAPCKGLNSNPFVTVHSVPSNKFYYNDSLLTKQPPAYIIRNAQPGR